MKWLFLLAVPSLAFGAVPKLPTTYLLPLNCAELLPEASTFVGFVETAARGLVAAEPKTSKRIFRILALRQNMSDALGLGGGQNPVDILIQKTLCYYREQKEPMKAIPYDDPDFIQYLRGAIPQLEDRVEEAVYQWELEKAQKQSYELKVQRYQQTIELFQRQAEKEAQITFQKLSRSAKTRVKTQK